MTFLIRQLEATAQAAEKEAQASPGVLKSKRLIHLAELLRATARSLPKETD